MADNTISPQDDRARYYQQMPLADLRRTYEMNVAANLRANGFDGTGVVADGNWTQAEYDILRAAQLRLANGQEVQAPLLPDATREQYIERLNALDAVTAAPSLMQRDGHTPPSQETREPVRGANRGAHGFINTATGELMTAAIERPLPERVSQPGDDPVFFQEVVTGRTRTEIESERHLWRYESPVHKGMSAIKPEAGAETAERNDPSTPGLDAITRRDEDRNRPGAIIDDRAAYAESLRNRSNAAAQPSLSIDPAALTLHDSLTENGRVVVATNAASAPAAAPASAAQPVSAEQQEVNTLRGQIMGGLVSRDNAARQAALGAVAHLAGHSASSVDDIYALQNMQVGQLAALREAAQALHGSGVTAQQAQQAPAAGVPPSPAPDHPLQDASVAPNVVPNVARAPEQRGFSV